jgi:hypothetical protein
VKVLVACEYSGVVRDAFGAMGHDAWSCDVLPTEQPGQHMQGDVRDYLNDGWDLMVAHPPCTRLCNSGVRWLHERNLWDDLSRAAEFFRTLLDAPIRMVAVENPVPHKYAIAKIGRPDQYVQPWEFGDPESKRTGLWLRNLPPLKPWVTERPPIVGSRVHRMPPGPDRARERSRFWPGIATAMAEQWTLAAERVVQP